MTLIDLAQQIGLNPKKVSMTQGGEYHSACPSCGGDDRFIIQPNKIQKNCTGYFFCRRCNSKGDIIQFAIEYLGCTFKEATELLGVDIKNNFCTSIFKTPYKPIQIPITISNIWQSKAEHFLETAHQTLLQNQPILDYLAQRGISTETVTRYKLGWSNQDYYYEKSEWGLTEQNNSSQKLWIPKGLVIPIIESNKILRLKVRRHNWQPTDDLPKYVAISGSMSGLSIIGNKKNPIMIVVETELDAYALHSVVDDFAVIIAIGGSTKNPDTVTDYLAKQKTLLICSDVDFAGEVMWNKWKTLYPDAIKCEVPTGKDIGEAIEHGLDLRSWIISKIPETVQYDLKLKTYPWDKEDEHLIDWALHYINTEGANSNFYQQIKKEIELGPKSPQAQTRELQDKLSLMKELAKKEYKRRGVL